LFDSDRKGKAFLGEFISSLARLGLVLPDDPHLVDQIAREALLMLDPAGGGEWARFREFCIGIARVEGFTFAEKASRAGILLAKVKELVLRYRNAFLIFDIDGDGEVNREEFTIIMTQLAEFPDQLEIASLISENDRDGGGEIDFNEFVAMITIYPTGHPLRRKEPTRIQRKVWEKMELFTEGFRHFDFQSRGLVSKEDIIRLCGVTGEISSMGERDARVNMQASILNGDTTGNGALSMPEFAKCILSRMGHLKALASDEAGYEEAQALVREYDIPSRERPMLQEIEKPGEASCEELFALHPGDH